jgi:hypothetical protein
MDRLLASGCSDADLALDHRGSKSSRHNTVHSIWLRADTYLRVFSPKQVGFEPPISLATRAPDGMRSTPRAMSLIEPVRAWLVALGQLESAPQCPLPSTALGTAGCPSGNRRESIYGIFSDALPLPLISQTFSLK